jgi:K+-transporting ATPase ATPase A chain
VGQGFLFLAIVTALVWPMGGYLERVFSRQPTWLDHLCGPLERAIYRITRVRADDEMSAAEYSGAFVLLGLAGAVAVYALLRLQQFLPWFFGAFQATPAPDLSFNTAVSFATTTTWQAYAGETISYTSQLVALGVQNFLAGASGLAVGIAFIRGFARDRSSTIGNFWVDVTRALLWVLAPLSIVGAIVLVWQGVPMNVHASTAAATLDNGRQVIAQGPVAAFEAIKSLGTNGGGFFNANGAHPFENPTPLTNILELLAMAVIPAALTNTFGRMIRQPRQGWLLYIVMTSVLVSGAAGLELAERQIGRPLASAIGSPESTAGSMEGKETRFGVSGSSVTAAVTSSAATGSVNAAPDSLTPLGAAILLVNLLLGEIAFGGLGTGLISVLMAALVAVFLAGLMVGHTPQFVGKRLGTTETKFLLLYLIIPPLVVLPLAALAVLLRAGLAPDAGAHGLTQILGTYASSFANNGLSFGGLTINSAFYNVTTALAMMGGRYGLAIPALALAGLVARQGIWPETRGTLRTDTATFGVLLAISLVVLTSLSYAAILVLGPVVEHLTLFRT